MFFFGQGTQGAEQRIYPYPLFDNLTHQKADKDYRLVYLENDYVKVAISPELGGRLFSGIDKTNGYEFIYRQSVIKPALIGMTGAWISGGVEWNIPHHHRASTFSPVQYTIEEHPDGAKTVWVGELEIRHRTRWAVGYTLYPGSSVVDCEVRIGNRMPIENTMLCFANIAVHINEDYQVIFPPHTQWSTSHSKRKFNAWPMVNGKDVSWYKNNLRGHSWFAVNDQDDFVAGFDHGRNAGLLTIANRHLVPGKKFFTWGMNNMWDDILTDEDGPYLEIMVGAYSDNQPDYSWLQPFEQRAVTMSLVPFRGISGVKNSTRQAAVNLEVKDGAIQYGFYTSTAFANALVRLHLGDQVLSENITTIDPAHPFTNEVPLPAGADEHSLRAVLSVGGKELVAYTPVQLDPIPMPEEYDEPNSPEDIGNIEELFLTGQRIYQFHHPKLDADPYWKEVLRRDPGHTGANTGLGLLAFQRARYEDAEKYFTTAVQRLTRHHTASKNVEPIYYLGLSQKTQGRLKEAYSTLYKATWKQEWKAPAYFALAEIASIRGDYEEALDLLNQSLDANTSNVRAYVLKSAILRQLGRSETAGKVISKAMEKCDPLDAQLMAEAWLMNKTAPAADRLIGAFQKHPVNAEEVAAGYMNAGLWRDGQAVLNKLIEESDEWTVSPLIYYYLAYFAEQVGEAPQALYAQARQQPMDYVFPFQHEMIPVLRRAIEANPTDPRAPYYLGNLLYDWQPEKATELWELSAKLDPTVPIAWRNLAVAYAHQNDPDGKRRAIIALEKAVDRPNPHPTHLAELDALYRGTGVSLEKRLALIEQNSNIVRRKDEALGNWVRLETLMGREDRAISLMGNRTFSIWEGGGAFSAGEAWADAHLVKAMKALKSKDLQSAKSALERGLNPPKALHARNHGKHESQMKFRLGCLYEKLGKLDQAENCWKEILSSKPPQSGVNQGIIQAWLYWRTLARKKLDPVFDIREFMTMLTDMSGNLTVSEMGQADYQFIRINTLTALEEEAYPHYLAGLGYLALDQPEQAYAAFGKAMQISPDFMSAKIALIPHD
jgi:tetratricopeptide (TPR) repeat protein